MKKKVLGKFFCISLLFLNLISCSNKSRKYITIDGSSTVYPITEIIAEEFNYLYPEIRISIGESGTGGGIKKFVNGEIDLVNASRKMNDSELNQAKANGINPAELIVANDGISIIVNPKNKFVDNLTKEELSHIFRNENPAKFWSDVRKDFPHELIKVYTPGAASGTFEFFTEMINEEAKSQREDAILSEDDNVLIRGIENEEYSIAYLGHSYYETNKTKIKLISINGIFPTNETINSGSYLLSRPLSLYLNKNDLNRDDINKFINFYLNNAQKFANEVNFVPLDENKYEAQLKDLF